MRKSEGTIIKRGAQQYRARITLREKEYSKTFISAGDAEAWLLKLRLSADEDDRAHQLYVQKLTVAELLTRFCDEVASQRASLESRRREVSRCNTLLKQQPQLSSMKAVNLQPRHIATYVVDRRAQGASDGSIRAELAIIRRTFPLAGGAWRLGFDHQGTASSLCEDSFEVATLPQPRMKTLLREREGGRASAAAFPAGRVYVRSIFNTRTRCSDLPGTYKTSTSPNCQTQAALRVVQETVMFHVARATVGYGSESAWLFSPQPQTRDSLGASSRRCRTS